METLFMAEHHRNQGCDRTGGRQIPDRSSPSRSFKNINCRTFQSTGGIFPSPTFNFQSYPSTGEVKSPRCYSEPPKPTKRSISNPIPITNPKQLSKKFAVTDDMSSSSELWAGPAYSNSPPPSSLPMPKFSLRQKRSVSLELSEISKLVIDLPPAAKSAPSSPKREWSPPPPGNGLFASTASATETLRRILHLDD